MNTFARCLCIALALSAFSAGAPSTLAESNRSAQPGTVAVLQIDGAIGPATARYVIRGLQRAQQEGSRLIVLTLDTPGGLDSSMRDIIRAILASPNSRSELCQSFRGSGRERRHLHPVCESRRRDGACYEPWGRDAGLDRR